MFFDLTTFDLLEVALPVIELDAVERAGTRTPWKYWSYVELGKLAGDRVDWQYPGRIRVAITGGNGRSWMRRHYRLWWTVWQEYKGGLVFTANPRVGLSWDKRRIGERVARDAAYLSTAAAAAIHMQPLFRPDFLALQAAADKIRLASRRLLEVKGIEDGPRKAQTEGDTKTLRPRRRPKPPTPD